MNILRKLNLADFTTLMNAASGLLAVFYSITGKFATAAVFILIAVVLDFLDGRIARRFRQSSGLGKELDSLADTISFGVAPAVFGFMLSEKGTLITAIVIIFVLCGILRLARFNIANIKHFEGMPITVNGILFPLIYFINVPVCYFQYIYLLSAIAMISTFKIKKLR